MIAKRKTKQETGKIKEARKTREKPVWLKFNDKDIEAIVVKLAKQGLTTEKIGLTLRDNYGIPTTKLHGKKISKILRENKLYKDATLSNLENKQQAIKQHLEKNKKDKKARRALTIINARIAKLKKYKKKRENVVAR